MPTPGRADAADAKRLVRKGLHDMELQRLEGGRELCGHLGKEGARHKALERVRDRQPWKSWGQGDGRAGDQVRGFLGGLCLTLSQEEPGRAGDRGGLDRWVLSGSLWLFSGEWTDYGE